MGDYFRVLSLVVPFAIMACENVDFGQGGVEYCAEFSRGLAAAGQWNDMDCTARIDGGTPRSSICEDVRVRLRS